MFAANRGYGIASSRLSILSRFVSDGWRVIVAARADGSVAEIRRCGAEFVDIPFRRGGANPLADAQALLALRRLYRVRPALVHHFNIKPVLLGSLAIGSRETVLINTITGKGYGFVKEGVLASALRGSARLVLPRSTFTIFQNPDDLQYFVRHGLVAEDRARLLRSAGVDLDRFEDRASGEPEATIVLFVGRLLGQKGVREFVEMAEILAADHAHVQFCLAGEADHDHPDAVPLEWVLERQAAGAVRYLGYCGDVPRLLRSATIAVCPSVTGEGSPRVALEAAACGLPVVTTDVSGARQTVIDGETGFLVAPGDSAALAERVDVLLRDAVLRSRFGRAGRMMVEREFDQAKLVEAQFSLYRDAGVSLAGL